LSSSHANAARAKNPRGISGAACLRTPAKKKGAAELRLFSILAGE
jgi:hypothetical protein